MLLFILSGCKEKELPIVTTGDISSITQTSAICKGYLFSHGSCEVTSKGICWNTTGEPTIYDDTITVDSSTTFTIKLTDLVLNTKYYVRAFSINCEGTSYGKTKSFTTDPPYLPEVKTLGVSSITKTFVKSGGNVTSDGASQIIDRGLCWGKSMNPTLTDNYISIEPGAGSFNITLTGLESNTDYFVRAYATNHVGTGYGESRFFTTSFEANPDYPIDPDYPTTFFRLDSTTLSQKRSAFAEKNIYLRTSLDEYGFCGYGGGLVDAESSPVSDLTRDEAIEVIKRFISINPAETGIENPSDLDFSKLRYSTNGAGNILWHYSAYQTYETIEVLGAVVQLNILYSEVTSCTGNWYPNIYIPDNYVLNQEQAKTLLLGRVVSNYDGVGLYSITISAQDLYSSSVKPVIFPIETEEKIELRVSWQIWMDSISFQIYVDVMTGEILGRVPTIDF